MKYKLNRNKLRKFLINLLEKDFFEGEYGVNYDEHTDLSKFGLDSLDSIEIIMSIEKEFDIQIYDDDIDSIETQTIFNVLNLLNDIKEERRRKIKKIEKL